MCGTIAVLDVALAQDAGGAGADVPARQSLERVIVTGSMLPRIDAETALPVQIIRRDEIERSGASTAEELVGRLSANLPPTNGGTIGLAAGIGNYNSPGFSGVSLRGLDTRSTLVLLNGRRLANYAFSDEVGIGVDLKAIPVAAIERIEVLTDGASAIYGSDAVAGVVNFILRRDFQGVQVDVMDAQAQERGGGGRSNQTLTFGAGDVAVDGYNLFAVVDHHHDQSLAARDRSFASSWYQPDHHLDKTNYTSFPANLTLDDGRVVNPAAPGCTALTVYKNGGCYYDGARQGDILPDSDNLATLLHGSLALPGGAQAYAELLWSRQETNSQLTPTPINQPFYDTNPGFSIEPSSPYYPQGLGISGPITNPYFRLVPLGQRVERTVTENWRALAGWQGRLLGWDVDTAVLKSSTRSTDIYEAGFVDSTLLSNALQTGLINPFGDSGAAGDALLRSTSLSGPVRDGLSVTESIDLRAHRDIGQWANRPVTLGFGVEARHEHLDDTTLPIAPRIAGGAFPQGESGAARDAQALFAELALPLTHRVDGQLALRVDRYSDFGTHASPKLALRWHPLDSLLLRGSIGAGFRAPSLPELYSRQVTYEFESMLPDPKRCPITQAPSDCDVTVPAVFGGNSALQPETSRQTSLGIVFEPQRDATLTLDWWHLKVSNTVTELDPYVVLQNAAMFESTNIVRGPVDPAFPTLPGPIKSVTGINENLGEIQIQGLDVAAQWRSAMLPFGRFGAKLDGSYLVHWLAVLDGIDEASLIGGMPRWQHTLTVDWDRAGWHATVTHHWRAGYQDVPDAEGNERRVSPYSTWDTQLGYARGDDWSLTAGVGNLFNADPPFVNPSGYAQVGFDPSYADPRGRTFYLRASYRWR